MVYALVSKTNDRKVVRVRLPLRPQEIETIPCLFQGLKNYKIYSHMVRKVIGVVGPIASGKGTVAKILEEKGYKFYSLSNILKDEIRRRGLEVSRYTCNMVSNDMRLSQGADVLARKTVEIIEEQSPELAVVDAIRNPLEIELLKQQFNIYIIGVVTDQKRRFDLFISREKLSDVRTWEQFKDLDDREMEQEGEYKQQIKACLEFADVVIENNGTIDELRRQVEEIVKPYPG